MAKLAAAGTDIQLLNGSIYFWIARGWLDDIPAVRGPDTIVPSRPGRTKRNRVADRFTVVLNGQLRGSTPAGLLTLQLAMAAIWDPTIDPWDLVADDEYKGLASGQTATIAVRTLNIIPSANPTDVLQKYTWELECIADPPAWVLAGP